MENKAPEFKFKVGDEVVDEITGFGGVVVCRTQWLNNCNTYGVQPRKLKDGEPLKRQHFDEPQLVLTEENSFKGKHDTGGPTDGMVETNR